MLVFQVRYLRFLFTVPPLKLPNHYMGNLPLARKWAKYADKKGLQGEPPESTCLLTAGSPDMLKSLLYKNITSKVVCCWRRLLRTYQGDQNQIK